MNRVDGRRNQSGHSVRVAVVNKGGVSKTRWVGLFRKSQSRPEDIHALRRGIAGKIALVIEVSAKKSHINSATPAVGCRQVPIRIHAVLRSDRDSVGDANSANSRFPRIAGGLRLRVRRGESQNADGESGEDSNSPQGEYYLKLAAGGGGGGSSVAYHKSRQKRKRRKRRIGGRCGRRVGGGCSLRARFWVETRKIIPPSRGFLQIKGVVPSSSCCAGGVPARWRGDSRDGKQPPGIVSSAPPRCVLRSGASHSLQWGGMPALRRRFRNDDGGGFFCGWTGSCCGSMCWPREWSGTHAAAGAAARGGFCFCGLWEVLCVSLRAVAGAGMRSRASRDAFPSGAWERHRFNGGAVAVCFEGCCGRGG